MLYLIFFRVGFSLRSPLLPLIFVFVGGFYKALGGVPDLACSPLTSFPDNLAEKRSGALLPGKVQLFT
jgi:hypothetical protein